MANLVRRTPRSLARRWDWPFDRLFDELWEDLLSGFDLAVGPWRERQFVPPVDVTETNDELVVTAELPGMHKDDIEVVVHDGALVLRGEKKEEKASEDAGYQRIERRYGRFERHLPLPSGLETDKIEATYKDGVLRLRIPKAEAAKARTVEIKTE